MSIQPLLSLDEDGHSRYAQEDQTTRQDLRKSVPNNWKTKKERAEEHLIAPTVLGAVLVESLVSIQDISR